MTELQKTLSVWRGTALFINIVLGAGLLVLPGLTVQKIGDLSFVSWLVCALLATPFFIIFIILGSRYPGPGGIATFVQQAYGKLAYIIASFMLLGAVVLGLPAIALTGGYYASSTFGGSSHLYALTILAGVLVLNLQSVELAGKLNQWLSWVLVAFLVVLALFSFSLVYGEPTHSQISLPSNMAELEMIWLVIPMIFFAFTGWEVGASITGEFKEPKKDLPIAMWMSFLLAVSLYLVMAYVAQRADLNGNYTSPFTAIINNHVGSYGSLLVGLVSITLIYANLCAATWGVSRMVYSLSKERIAPTYLHALTKGQPYYSLITIIAVFFIIVILDWVGLLGIERLLTLAGQNFIILYGFSAMALVKLAQRWTERVIAILGLAVCAAIVILQGGGVLYPLLIATLSTMIYIFKLGVVTADVQ
ncbi:amino acid permease [Halomonas campisalis]|uniref:Amino acid permease n=1 Tax=Billgrantia campisalis TaxID=74661 RepID=A0ABS9P6X7_9GAMM|nr:amino acid permease [Halomonas campisalis]MCG6657541.1 amino acid permease [Halomonas campisalis]MDR5862687.1 amino acid permease [Halomonas campisalis]